MLKRTITAIVAVMILLPVLWFSDTYIFPAAISIALLISLYEMFACLGFKNKFEVTLPAFIVGGATPFIIKIYSGSINTVISALCALMILYILYLMMISVFLHNKYSIKDISMCYLTAVYIVCGFFSIQFLREMSGSIYLLIFIGAWVTDIFAYFTGMLMGKHKLIPEVSPKKTIEGSIGGTLFCALSFIVFGIIVDNFFGMNANLIFLAISGVIVSIVAQMGDLIMSLIKREYGIKDYGKLCPGHGGILDRFDSILSVSLILAIICIFAGITNIRLI